MSKLRSKKELNVKKLEIEQFWNLDEFKDFKSWSRYWKPRVNVTLDKDLRVDAKKAQRYDDLWDAHVALMNDKCPSCEKTEKLGEEIKRLQEENKELDAKVKTLNKPVAEKPKTTKKDK